MLILFIFMYFGLYTYISYLLLPNSLKTQWFEITMIYCFLWFCGWVSCGLTCTVTVKKGLMIQDGLPHIWGLDAGSWLSFFLLTVSHYLAWSSLPYYRSIPRGQIEAARHRMQCHSYCILLVKSNHKANADFHGFHLMMEELQSHFAKRRDHKEASCFGAHCSKNQPQCLWSHCRTTRILECNFPTERMKR